jgi:single-stranded-DNA-specific exonuclease
MLTEDDDRAREVARELDGLNHDRRETEARILHEAEAACADQMSAAALVVAGEGWHPGVVGIVASRLVERFRRPAVVIALDGGSGRGSGRSIPAYDLHAGLAAASAHLLGFGGHRMAAGLQIDSECVARFRRALADHAGAQLAPGDLKRIEHIDAVVAAGALNLRTAEELERLGPFGPGNPAPRLLVPGARIEHVTAMGEERKHARFSLVGGGARARGVAFRRSQRSLAAAGASPHDVAVSLERNRWNGAVEARVVLRELSPSAPGEVRDVGEGDFWTQVAGELDCDPTLWWPAPDPTLRPARLVHDRRGEGLAGTCADLLTSGESVLVVVADVARRRPGLESAIAGLARGGLAVVCWEALGARPELASEFDHLLALDPPPSAEGHALLAGAPGAGCAHVAWGPAEIEFTLAFWRYGLDLRAAAGSVWRALNVSGALNGAELEDALRGDGAYPRQGVTAGRLLRVLSDVGLIACDLELRAARVVSTQRTSLEASTSFRAYAARLSAAHEYLDGRQQLHPKSGVIAS